MNNLLDKKEHMFQYDFIRSVSMIFVIAVHSLVIIDFSDTISLFYFYVMQTVFFTCNGMFFLMSGKFAITKSKVSWSYYSKKIETIIIPMLLYMGIRSIFMCINSTTNTFSIPFLISNILGGLGNTEYWFLYVLIGDLLIAPLLAKAFLAWSKKEHIIFSVFIFTHGVLVFICSFLGITYSFNNIFYNWSFYFFIGYSIDVIFEKKSPIIFIFGFFALICTTILKYVGFTQFVHDLSPIFMILVLAVYFLIYSIAEYIPEFMKSFFTFLAKHSFSVYLCHMMVLEAILKKLPKIEGIASIVNHLFLAFLTLFVSVFLAVFLDNTLINWIQYIFRKVQIYFYEKCKME